MTNLPNWLDTSIYPFRSNFLPLSMGNMHYVDEGTGDPVLFVHGTPSWSFLYRKLIKELSNNFRCIAPDHIGFGLSDKPDSWSYKLQEHTENLKSLIDHLELQNITLVVHDFGGMIALPLACDEPQRFKRIIAFNTWAGSNEENLGFERTKKLLESSITQFLYKYLNASARWVMKDAAYNKSFLKGNVHQHYIKPFSKPSERIGPLSFLDSYLHDNEYFDECAARLEAIAHLPALIIWGMNDKYISKDKLNIWLKVFDNQEVHRLENCGHWVMEEKPAEVVEIVKSWLSKSH